MSGNLLAKGILQQVNMKLERISCSHAASFHAEIIANYFYIKKDVEKQAKKGFEF